MGCATASGVARHWSIALESRANSILVRVARLRFSQAGLSAKPAASAFKLPPAGRQLSYVLHVTQRTTLTPRNARDAVRTSAPSGPEKVLRIRPTQRLSQTARRVANGWTPVRSIARDAVPQSIPIKPRLADLRCSADHVIAIAPADRGLAGCVGLRLCRAHAQ